MNASSLTRMTIAAPSKAAASKADIEAAVLVTGRPPHWFDVHDSCDPNDCRIARSDRDLARARVEGKRAERIAADRAQDVAGIPSRRPRSPEPVEMVGTFLDPEPEQGRHWHVESDSSSRLYLVEARTDTKYGGTYMHCECAGWRFAVAKGGCKHVRAVKTGLVDRCTGECPDAD